MGLLDSLFSTGGSATGDYGPGEAPNTHPGLLGGFGTWLKDPRNAASLAEFGRALSAAGAPSPYKSGWGGALGSAFGAFNQAGNQFDQQEMQKKMQALQLQQLQQSVNQKVDPRAYFDKVSPDKYTPESITAFMAGNGDFTKLQPVRKKEFAPNGVAVDPYTVTPGQNFAAPIKVDTGNALSFLDPATFKSVADIQKGVSPDAELSAHVQTRGQDMTNARASESNAINANNNLVTSETGLRKEFQSLPEVQNYKLAFPSFKAIQSASMRNNPQADINLIYGLAKLYDPTSVVREGEYNTIANSQAIPDWLKGQAQRLVGGGRLSGETKRQIMVEANQRIKAYEAEYSKAQSSFGNIAAQRGVGAANIFTPVGNINPDGGFKGAPMVGQVVDGYRYKGGDPADQTSWEKK